MSEPRSAAEVQRDIERQRTEIRDTISEIQERLTPGQLFDQALDYFREHPSRSATGNRIGRAIVENPLPVLMVGAGLAWLAYAAAARDTRPADPGEGRFDERGPGPLARMGRSRMTSTGPGPAVMGASTLIGDKVSNDRNESLGKIEEIMIDMSSGRVAYAVLSFGGVLGMGDKLFAVPWHALRLDTANKQFVLSVSKERLKNAEGFDKNAWPTMSDPRWATETHSFYETPPYWE